MKFLVDECLTVDLVATAREAGHEASHVAHLGRAGWKDWSVAAYAAAHDCVLVTNNAGDFRRLYAARRLHAGLIIIIPTVNRAMQQALFRAVLSELAVMGEPVNQVIEVDRDGTDVIFTFHETPLENPAGHRRIRSRPRR